MKKTKLVIMSLPFKGKWFVYWGGDTKRLNPYHHAAGGMQKFAFDFVVMGKNGKTYNRNGNKNEDYYAFGKEILAPADGIVTDVINGVRDNIPGSMNKFSALGNAVFIQHHKNVISVLVHLKLDSIKVKAGNRVKKGQTIAFCGNSGNSSEPHLHYHLQNKPFMQKADGIKIYFDNVMVEKNGKVVLKEKYSPVKKDAICSFPME
jgi:murein DD-endopeptidase MepM/ murein hydrolase activator NlpD